MELEQLVTARLRYRPASGIRHSGGSRYQRKRPLCWRVSQERRRKALDVLCPLGIASETFFRLDCTSIGLESCLDSRSPLERFCKSSFPGCCQQRIFLYLRGLSGKLDDESWRRIFAQISHIDQAFDTGHSIL